MQTAAGNIIGKITDVDTCSLFREVFLESGKTPVSAAFKNNLLVLVLLI